LPDQRGIWNDRRMLFELRRYLARPGKRDELVRLMDEEIIPFQISCGVVVVGSFVDEENPDVYIWIRRFDDEAHRQRTYLAVYESPEWVNGFKDRVGALIDREAMQVTRMLPTPRSVIR
jgi:hypothetical protein